MLGCIVLLRLCNRASQELFALIVFAGHTINFDAIFLVLALHLIEYFKKCVHETLRACYILVASLVNDYILFVILILGFFIVNVENGVVIRDDMDIGVVLGKLVKSGGVSCVFDCYALTSGKLLRCERNGCTVTCQV